MNMTRRAMLAASAGAVTALSNATAAPADIRSKRGLGLVIHSFAVRMEADKGTVSKSRFGEPIRFLDHCRTLGVSAIQMSIGARDESFANDLRTRAESASMDLEAIVSLPRDDADLARFEAEIRTAKQAGATIVRTVMLNGRRYETFDSTEAFRKFADRATHSLSLAAPIIVRHGVRLAVENHKDWRADEFIRVLKGIGYDHIGICLDTGNNMALLEDPMETVETLAPFAVTTHFKDMGVQEYSDGFLLAEVPLGTGVLDLARVVRILRAARPEIRFNIEMITRDPLKIPCLTDRYWATFPTLPGRNLARSLSLVRSHAPPHALRLISKLDEPSRIKVEDENIQRCLAYARESLGL